MLCRLIQETARVKQFPSFLDNTITLCPGTEYFKNWVILSAGFCKCSSPNFSLTFWTSRLLDGSQPASFNNQRTLWKESLHLSFQIVLLWHT